MHQVILVQHSSHSAPVTGECCGSCEPQGCFGRHGFHHCCIEWLKPWTCEDLEMKPVEPAAKLCGCSCLYNFLWCPPEEEEEKEEEKNGNGEEKKNGNGEEKKNGNGEEKKNGNGEEKKEGEPEEEGEEEEDLTPLMQAIQCCCPDLFCHLDSHGTKVYGWVQQGFTANFDSPEDRTNFGTPFNFRSNEYRLNQAYIVLENALEHEGCFNIGYRVDFFAGTDAPWIEAISPGFLDHVVNEDDIEHRIGVSLPQFYVEAHLPGVITEKGLDVRVGRMYTMMGWELIPAIQTDFYSHSYEFFYSVPFTHTGLMTNLHLTDTLNMWNCLLVGWDNVFDDNNDGLTYHGALQWNACDQRSSLVIAWITGPEATDNNDDYRTQVTAYYSQKFGCCDQWRFVFGGNTAWEENAADADAGQDAEWYGVTSYLFYTVRPDLILGLRGEWFRDDDGVRTGFVDNFYEVTANVAFKPYQNLWVRPELRVDWSDETQPYNDQQDSHQFTAAVDVIWQY
jgi:hypothetical protein